ncbi:TIGR03960 family B12-binding radical SAM protein [Spirochaetota bacterium]
MEREDILISAQKPQQYLGNEINAVKKDLSKCALKIVLVFPDTYTIGMSNYAIKILYELINREKDIACERAFLPEKDILELLLARDEPLFSLESFVPLGTFDIIGITVPSELLYTNVLHVLRLSRLALYAAQRDETAPLVLAGGISMGNPEPLSPFMDAFYLGDGEEVFLSLLRKAARMKKKKRMGKKEMLALCDTFENIYIPSLHRNPFYSQGHSRYCAESEGASDAGDPQSATFHEDERKAEKTIKRACIKTLKNDYIPLRPVVPYIQTVQDRAQVEIARGCVRRCRFCLAGYVYRPYRERRTNDVVRAMEKVLRHTGYNDCNLSALSVSDHRDIKEIVKKAAQKLGAHGVSISLPSLRIDPFTDDEYVHISDVRKAGLTFAIESGSQKGRDIINKKITEDEILRTISLVYQKGWRLVKFYFMVGLPYLENEDDDIAGLLERITYAFPSLRINVNLNTFVPKPHTPFQWYKVLHYTSAMERINGVRERLRRYKRIIIRFQDPRMSYVEAFLSLGSRGVSTVLMDAYNKGALFDAWDDRINADLWIRLIGETDFDEYNKRDIDIQRPLPWDMFSEQRDLCVKEFIKAEEEKKEKEEKEELHRGPQGTTEKEEKKEKEELHRGPQWTTEKEEKKEKETYFDKHRETAYYIKITFEKKGLSRFISHKDLCNYFEKVLRMSDFPFAFSKGYSPHPILSIPYPVPLGVESEGDILLAESIRRIDCDALKRSLNEMSKSGIRILNIKQSDRKIQTEASGVEYTIKVEEGSSGRSMMEIRDKIRIFNDSMKTGDLKRSITVSMKDMPGGGKVKYHRRKKKVERIKQIHPYDELTSIMCENNIIVLVFKKNISLKLYLSYLQICGVLKIKRKLHLHDTALVQQHGENVS